MRFRYKVAIAVGAAAITLIAGSLAYLGWALSRRDPPDDRLPMIARSLPNSILEADRVFDQRASRWFPDGTDANVIAMELNREGFRLHAIERGETYAFFEQQTFPCAYHWMIQWRRDTQGRAHDIRARFMPTCL